MNKLPHQPKTDFGLNKNLLKTIKAALGNEDTEVVLKHIRDLHAADVADLIESLPVVLRRRMLDLLRQEQLDGDILTELNEYIREEFLEQLTPEELASTVATLETDDAVTLLDDLDVAQQQEVLQALPEADRVELTQALTYPEDSAGRLMQREVVVAPAGSTIGQVIDSLESYEELPENFYDIFVVDQAHRPIGAVPLSHLLKHPRRTLIVDIMSPDIRAVPVTMDQEEVAYLFQQYGLTSVPVVDEHYVVIGMITVDDVMFVIQEEADEDFIHLGRVTEDTFHGSVMDTSMSRLRWLFVTFINTLIASSVIYHFEPVLEKVVAVAVLMPIVAAMGGNAGMQVVTVTVRAIAKRDLHNRNFLRVLGREVVVASINAFLFATLIATIAGFWYQNSKLGLTLAAAMVFNIMWSGIAGTVFPIILHKIGLDPAISSGPLLTTTTDVLGFAVFLGLASHFLI
jgi:magnesium transporter